MTTVSTIQPPTVRKNSVAPILQAAKQQRKGDLLVYTDFKRQMNDLPLTSGEYESAHMALIRILEV